MPRLTREECDQLDIAVGDVFKGRMGYHIHYARDLRDASIIFEQWPGDVSITREHYPACRWRCQLFTTSGMWEGEDTSLQVAICRAIIAAGESEEGRKFIDQRRED